MTGAPGTRPVVTPADTARARVLVATWEAGDDRLRVPTGNLLELRGLIAAALADARADARAEAVGEVEVWPPPTFAHPASAHEPHADGTLCPRCLTPPSQ